MKERSIDEIILEARHWISRIKNLWPYLIDDPYGDITTEKMQYRLDQARKHLATLEELKELLQRESIL